MQAVVGDEVVVKGRHVGDKDREGVIAEVRGSGGAPPYLIRWRDGHESVLMPSCGAVVVNRPAARQAD